MNTCISVPIIVGNDTMYKNIYTGEVSSEPQFSASIFELEKENAKLKSQLAAVITSKDILEECLVEMAGIVYA